MPPALSVLDLSPVASGKTARDALLSTLALAQHADALGLSRYWVAEHHNAKGLACSAPAVTIARIAAATSRLRVGSGGVMLPNHAPLHVAETFRTLEAYFPGRVDLGVGRAAGTDPRTARLLRRTDASAATEPTDFASELEALLAFLGEREAPRRAFATSVVAIPAIEATPEVFLLGSSVESARFAARSGLGFAYAHHFVPGGAVEALRAYRDEFTPSAWRRAPWSIVAVSAFAAADDAEADDAKACARLAALRFARGERDLPLPTIAEARAHAFDDEDRALVDAALAARSPFVATAKSVRDRLRALAHDGAADEVMATTPLADDEARRASYTRLADVW